jgi:hypothetical protein
VRTATKKVGGFLSGHSCHPLGWQNCREGSAVTAYAHTCSRKTAHLPPLAALKHLHCQGPEFQVT